MPIEGFFAFHGKYWSEFFGKAWATARLWWTYRGVSKAIDADPTARAYTDLSLTPVTDDELDHLDMFTTTDAAKAVVIRARQRPAPVRTAAKA
jgi:hypothetical protein